MKICIWANLKVIKTNRLRFLYLKYKFEQIGPNIKLNLLENYYTSQFEDSEYKHDVIKGFLNSNPDLGKCLSSMQFLSEWHKNLLPT